MLVKYNGYNELLSDDICVAMCYFNPLQYQKPLNNIRTVQYQFDKYNIPYYTVELIYPNQYSVIKDAHVVKSNSVLFSKENLWNIAEKVIPDKFTKIVFLDADVLCSDPDWLNRTAKLLETNDLVHSMEYSYKDIHTIDEEVDLDLTSTKYSIVKAIKTNLEIDLAMHHTGFVLSIDRNFFHSLGGIFEYGITGYGDTLFWSAFIKDYEAYNDNFLKMPRFIEIRKKWNEYKQNALSISSIDRIDYLPGANWLHLRHGTKLNRQYSTRNKYVSGVFDLFYNEYGVLEINIKSEQNKDLIEYWVDRKEDE